MINRKIPVSPAIAECLFHCYISMRNAQEYARAIWQDPGAHKMLQKEFLRVSSGLSGVMSIIEIHVPADTRKDFDEQLKYADHLRLDNIKSLYARMTPAQQEMLEYVADGIVKKVVTFEQTK